MQTSAPDTLKQQFHNFVSGTASARCQLATN